jgi:hypothetical protein
MAKVRLLLVVTALAWVGSASAQVSDTDSGNVAVDGNVAPICILGAPSRNMIDLGQLTETAGTRIGKIAPLPVQSVTLPNSFCNFAGSEITMTTTALVQNDSTALRPGFARAVNFTASATNWASSPSSATSAAAADGSNPSTTNSGATQPLPKIADLTAELSAFSVPADSKLVSGDYQGAVIITLGPAASGDR